MTACGLAEVTPNGEWYRVGRAPDPWAWPDWSFVQADGTFGGRWDDPDSTYRSIYASSRRVGAYLETMAWARPDPAVDRDIAAIGHSVTLFRLREAMAADMRRSGIVELDGSAIRRSRGYGVPDRRARRS